MPLKILITLFVILVVWRTWRRRARNERSGREAMAWTLLWLLVLLASLWPHATDVAAGWVGIGRGADLLIFVSVVALFALVSWLLARVERLERSLTQVVRESALRGGEVATAVGGVPPTLNYNGGGRSMKYEVGDRERKL